MTPARAQAREDVTGTAVPPRPSAALAAEIGEHLRRTPPQLPAKYFYDALGSALFDAICQLPWYRITRAESALLTQHRAAILGPFGRSLTIAELGCGNGEKLGHLVAAATEPFAALRLIDISPAALEAARQRLERLAAGPIALHAATYEQGIDALATTGRAGPLLVLFLESNIGNFAPVTPRGRRRCWSAAAAAPPPGGASAARGRGHRFPATTRRPRSPRSRPRRNWNASAIWR